MLHTVCLINHTNWLKKFLGWGPEGSLGCLDEFCFRWLENSGIDTGETAFVPDVLPYKMKSLLDPWIRCTIWIIWYVTYYDIVFLNDETKFKLVVCPDRKIRSVLRLFGMSWTYFAHFYEFFKSLSQKCTKLHWQPKKSKLNRGRRFVWTSPTRIVRGSIWLFIKWTFKPDVILILT